MINFLLLNSKHSSGGGYAPYDTIFVQLGHHAVIGRDGQEYTYTESDYEEYYSDYSALIEYLKQFTNKIVIESIFYSVVPSKKSTNKYIRRIQSLYKKKEIYDDRANRQKKEKNDIARRVAENSNCSYLDINQIMLTDGKHFRHNDHIHFEDAAKTFIVKKMAQFL